VCVFALEPYAVKVDVSCLPLPLKVSGFFCVVDMDLVGWGD
jgi:hypothetical protein